mgnify:CR=1 FL=1
MSLNNYLESIGQNCKNLNSQINQIKLAEFKKKKSDNYEDVEALDWNDALNVYKFLKSKNATTEKFRNDYYKSFYKSLNSIFDKKIKLDEDSVSEEEKDDKELNEIVIWQNEPVSMFSQSEESAKSEETQIKSITRAREAPYRLIVIPGFLYENFDICWIQEIV